jgi:hypothetical protein
MPPTSSLLGGLRFLPSSRKPAISLSHSAALEGYQLPANTALLTFADFMIYLPSWLWFGSLRPLSSFRELRSVPWLNLIWFIG